MARRRLSQRALVALAQEAGLSVDWVDASGRRQSVSPETLRAVLSALGYPANSPTAIHDSRRRLLIERQNPPKLIVAKAGERICLTTQSRTGEFVFENGDTAPIRLRHVHDGVATFEAPRANGYHRLAIDGRELALAVTPARAFQATHRRIWGLAAQVYALRGGRTKGFGDFAALAGFIRRAGRNGADAIAISPVHAILPGPVEHYAPYSPSSRFALNPLFAAIPSGDATVERKALVSWRAASEAKVKALDLAYDHFLGNARARKDFAAFVKSGGSRLLAHARFEALHARFAMSGRTDWRRWPVQFRNASSADATRLGRGDRELESCLFHQWLAARDLAHAQKTASQSRMAVGVIADLAVGLNPRGSHAWSAPHELLQKLSIGAPPDALGPDGQDWGLTTLSPFAMRADGYASYLDTLRASMRHVGGMRIDHAMGLKRLWVIPESAPSSAGVYLSYPFEDLLRLLVLESIRNRVIVIAEDLGTVPAGFRERIARAGLLGMRVLFFERDNTETFRQPSKWEREVCALSTTHDLPTLSGWWRERDIDWRTGISRTFDAKRARQARAKDRERLWQAAKRARCSDGLEPAQNEERAAVDAAIRFVGKTRSRLAIISAEDISGVIEQPNLPGTVGEHPNWRRRLPPSNGLTSSRAKRRLEILESERPRS